MFYGCQLYNCVIPAQPVFTRGPWRTQGWVPTWAYIPVHDARHNLVCSLYPDMGHGYSREEVAANARLIAAAPELFRCLENLISNVESGSYESTGLCIQECRAVLRNAQNVVTLRQRKE